MTLSFKNYHIEQIKALQKTQTRREWADNYNKPKIGSIHIAATELFVSHEEADCYILIEDRYEEALGEMTDEDAQAEGDYKSVEEFKAGYERVYGSGAWDPQTVVDVVKFRYIGTDPLIEVPGADIVEDSTEIRTDGGQSVDGSERLLDVDVDHVNGLGMLKVDPEKHGWSIKTTIENYQGYVGDGVESVSAHANCFTHDSDDLRDLGNYLLEKADEMDQYQDTETDQEIRTDGGQPVDSSERLELEYTLDSSHVWSGDLLEDITHFIETEKQILPPKKPRIKVTVEIVAEDDKLPEYTADVIEEVDRNV